MMMMTTSSPLTIAPLLLRNLLTSLFFFADKSLIHYSQKYQLLEFLRRFVVSAFLFSLRLLPSLFPTSHESPNYPSKDDNFSASTVCVGGGGDSSVARALSQLLLIMSDIPVSSRKYDVVRSLAEKFMDENLLEGNQSLKEVNCAVLSAAFARSLSQLEAAMVDHGRRSGEEVAAGGKDDDHFYNRARGFVRGVTRYGRVAWRYARPRDELSRTGISAEKLAAEILWLAQKMTASGCVDEAVCRWASASNLAWLSLSAEPRLQGSLVKVSAFLIKQSKKMGQEEEGKNATPPSEHTTTRKTKMKMLMSWLPLLCQANNGTDSPILNTGERAELERILEEIISTLNEEEEQEQVMSQWLHHFTYCPASDWPNLRTCYTRWFNASRQRLLLAAVSAPSKLNR